MRITPTVMALALLAAGAALADPPQGASAGQHQSQIDRLTTELNLSADQKEKVQKVLDDQHAKMQSMHDQAQSSGQRPSRDEMHKQREAMNQELQEQLKPILSDEQMQKFKQLQQQHQAHMGRRQGAHPEGSTQPPTQ
jgi:septal ring factor EnvC (AmiA/AmiB activator)